MKIYTKLYTKLYTRNAWGGLKERKRTAMPYMNLGEFLLATEWENKEVESVVRAIKIAIQDGVLSQQVPF